MVEWQQRWFCKQSGATLELVVTVPGSRHAPALSQFLSLSVSVTVALTTLACRLISRKTPYRKSPSKQKLPIVTSSCAETLRTHTATFKLRVDFWCQREPYGWLVAVVPEAWNVWVGSCVAGLVDRLVISTNRLVDHVIAWMVN